MAVREAVGTTRRKKFFIPRGLADCLKKSEKSSRLKSRLTEEIDQNGCEKGSQDYSYFYVGSSIDCLDKGLKTVSRLKVG
jgi:hypothetical protein